MIVTGKNYSGGTAGPIQVRRGTTVIGSGTGGGGDIILFEKPGAGTYEYNIYVLGTILYLERMKLLVRVIRVNDTHNAVLEGDNTQHTKNTKFIEG